MAFLQSRTQSCLYQHSKPSQHTRTGGSKRGSKGVTITIHVVRHHARPRHVTSAAPSTHQTPRALLYVCAVVEWYSRVQEQTPHTQREREIVTASSVCREASTPKRKLEISFGGCEFLGVRYHVGVGKCVVALAPYSLSLSLHSFVLFFCL